MSSPYAYTLARRDRWTLVAAFALLVGWERIKVLWPQPDPAAWMTELQLQPPTDAANTGPAYDAFAAKHQARSASLRPNHASLEKEPAARPTLSHPVDIMQGDESQLAAAGFPRHVVRNLLRYREAGGQIRDEAALLRIYGMDSVILDQVAEWIVFPENPSLMPEKPVHEVPRTLTDLNTATETELDALPGIGPSYASRIIRYRKMLGGFHRAEQLRECYGLPPETIDRILPLVEVRSPPAPLRINQRRLDTLYHPYVSRKILRVLEAYKAQHGNFENAEALRDAYPPDTTWIDKLLPYLVFDAPE